LYGNLPSRQTNKARTYISYNQLLYDMEDLDWKLSGGSVQRIQLNIKALAGERVAGFETYLDSGQKGAAL